ncbi:hypothetical protein BDR03DRAFT_954190 [Suillus americanus]|nr:hypothetical protein BDR03DRAFT_954190 [Suillus americanus]
MLLSGRGDVHCSTKTTVTGLNNRVGLAYEWCVVLILCFIYVKASRLLVLISVYIPCALFLVSIPEHTHLSLFVYHLQYLHLRLSQVYASLSHRSLIVSLFLWFLERLHAGHVAPYVNINKRRCFDTTWSARSQIAEVFLAGHRAWLASSKPQRGAGASVLRCTIRHACSSPF